jgi:hypothetical protein
MMLRQRVGVPAVSTKTDEISEIIQETIHAEVAPLFDELRRFTDRRIAELSAEIHAAVQMVDSARKTCPANWAGSRDRSRR